MGKRGPRPKPTKLNELAGNPGKRKRNKAEPQPEACARPPAPPAWLCPEGVAEWEVLVPQLLATRVLTTVDLTALALYCQHLGQWLQVQEQIPKRGLTYEQTTESGVYRQQTPEVILAIKLAEKILRFAQEFGLTPSSRSGLVAATDKPGGKLAAFQKKKSK